MANTFGGKEQDKLSEDDIPNLISILTPVAPKCTDLGLHLGVKDWQISIIMADYRNDCKAQLREIVKARLNQEKPLTWGDVITALNSKSVNECRVAWQIESHYLTSQPPLSSPSQQERPSVSHTTHTSLSLPSSQLSAQPGPAQSLVPHPQTQQSTQLPHASAAMSQTPPLLQSAIVNQAPQLSAVATPLPQPPHILTHTPQLSVVTSQSPQLYSSAVVGQPLPLHQPLAVESQPPQLTTSFTSQVGHPTGYRFATPRTPFHTSLPPHFPRAESQHHLQYQHNPFLYQLLQFMPPVPPPVPSFPQHSPWTGSKHHLPYQHNPFPQQSMPPVPTQHYPYQPQHPSSYIPPPYNPYFPPPQVATSVQSTHEVPGPPAAKRPREQPPVRPHPQPHPPPSQQQSTSQGRPDISPLVSRYIDYVRTVYRNIEVEKDTRTVKWPPTPSKVYINLVCIDRAKVSRGKRSEYDKVTEAMVKNGDVDVVHGKKWPIDFNDIATGVSDRGLEQVVLVEGAPGVGKSTFAWEYCRRWERGEIAKQYQLVILLRLRDERMGKANTLKDLITYESEDERQAVTDYLYQSHGSKTLVILEGFDELSDTCRTSQSVFLRLICGELLPLATVMVTSRPWATCGFHTNYGHRMSQHVEILGFTTQQISQYIESVLPAKGLLAYVKNRPQIRGCMYIPLNCAIVVTVYEERQASGCPLPSTLTELYTALAQTLLVRYLCGHPELTNDSFTHTIRVFKDLSLPREVQRNFTELCKLAYNGIVGGNDEVQLIFGESELPEDFDNLGFMDSVTELYVTLGAVSSHNFLHLTFQEFFAAVHISTLSPAEQMEHFKRHKDGRLKVVLRFLAGMSKLSCFSSETVEDTFLTPPQENGVWKSITCDAGIDVHLVNWLFEAQSDNVITLLNIKQYTIKFELLGLEQFTLEFFFDEDSMLPMDYYSVGYCIAHSQCQWVLDLSGVETIEEEETEMLVAGASLRPDTRARVVGICCCDFNDRDTFGTKCIAKLFVGLRNILQLHELSLPLSIPCTGIPWPDLSSLRVLTLVFFEEQLALDKLLPSLTLESLYIIIGDDVALSDDDCVAIQSYIRAATTLKELSFQYLCDENMEVIARALANNTQSLKKLTIWNGSFTDKAADHLAQFITQSTTLQHLDLSGMLLLLGCKLRVNGLRALAQALHHNSTLQKKQLMLGVMLDDGRNEGDLDNVLAEYPDMAKNIIIIIVMNPEDYE